MDINYFLVLLRQHSRAILKPLIIEAIKECYADATIQTDPSNDDRVVSTTEAMRLLGFKDRHSIYQAVKDGLPFVHKRPYKFRVSDIKQFNESNKQVKSSSR